MSYETTIAEVVANTAAAMTEINTRLQAMGWTLHDDQSAAGTPYYVWSSDGESGGEFTVYYRMQWSNTTDQVEVWQYLHWNNSTHSGTGRIGPSNGTNNNVSLSVDDDSSFTIWVYGDKDFVLFVSKISSTYNWTCIVNLEPYYKTEGTLQSSVSSGSSVVVTLAAGEADDFFEGQLCKIIGSGSGEGIEDITVESVNAGSNQVTVDSLARGYSANSMLGTYPRRWDITGLQNYDQALRPSHSGTGDFDPATGVNHGPLFGSTSGAVNELTGLFDMQPVAVAEGYDELGYFPDHFVYCNPNVTTREDTISVGWLEDGTASAGTSTTLTDSSQSWTVNEFQNKCVIITNGTGQGQIRSISSNTATALTVPTWDTNPDATSEYVICEKGYRYFYVSTTTHRYAVREV